MKSLLKLLAIVTLIGVLAGCRKTEEVAKDSSDAAPEVAPKVSKNANIVYNGVTIGQNTMTESARERADIIAAEVAKPAPEQSEK